MTYYKKFIKNRKNLKYLYTFKLNKFCPNYFSYKMHLIGESLYSYFYTYYRLTYNLITSNQTKSKYILIIYTVLSYTLSCRCGK